MKNWKEIKNKLTGQPNYTMTGKLIRVTSDVRENENGTQYRLCEITVPHPSKDESFRTTAQIYENNFNKGMTEGEEYLVTANPARVKDAEGNIVTRLYFAMSHLQGNPTMVTAEDLGLEIEEVVPTAKVSA